jgi:hypothetical protein
MKVIFLDIDGVLNSNDWYTNRKKNNLTEQYPLTEFDPKAVERLNRIILETGAKIVVSSSWRAGRSVNELQDLLISVGVIGEVVGKTNRLTHDTYNIPRGCEIDYWLKLQGLFQRINWSKEEQQKNIDKAKVKNYIILDDDSDMLYSQKEHFVHTDNLYGLTDEDVDNSISILRKSLVDLYYENSIRKRTEFIHNK